MNAPSDAAQGSGRAGESVVGCAGEPDAGASATDVPRHATARDLDTATDEERSARAALTRLAEPGDELVGRWLADYGAHGTLAALIGDRRLPGASGRRWSGLRQRLDGVSGEAELAAASTAGARFVCPGDPEWPRQLDDLGHGRPVGLWVRGRPSLRCWALRSVAVVGARACTGYGAHVATSLAAGLAERGWVVVSGAAYGVDAAAHRGALAASGATVAVLANGVDVSYPAGHRALISRVAEQGLVVSELPLGTRPTRYRFVLRNRVIAALTRGTVVVEAELRSGSLVTARHAARLGRCTMGVPGAVTSSLSAGVHELLRQEGTLVTDADEVVELVGRIGELAPPRRGPVLPRDTLAREAAQVLEALPARGTAPLARIARDAGMAQDTVLAALHTLVSLGFATRTAQGWGLAGHPDRHPIR